LAAAERRKKETGGLVGAHRVFRFGGFYSKLLRIKNLPMVVQHTFINTQSLLAIARVYPAYGRNDADTKNNPRGIEFIKNDVLPFFQKRQLSVGRIHLARSWEITPGHRNGSYGEFLDECKIGHQILRSGSEAARVLGYLLKAELNDFLLPALRQQPFGSLGELQAELDKWLHVHNEEVIHHIQPCFGRTAIDTFQAIFGQSPNQSR
jgi:hypothetical protein